MVDPNERTYKLEHESIPRLLWHYTLPALVGTMVISMYNIVDRIFIGQSVGDFGIAGLTLTFPVMILLQAFGMLVGTGAATRVSIHLGEKDVDGAERILGNAIILTLILQTLTIIPTLIWLEPMLALFGGSERTIPYAMDYLAITVPGNILASIAMSYNAVMRASGYPSRAMSTMIIGGVLNILLDAFFIWVLDWGIRGVAWATVISMGVSAGYVMWHFFDRRSLVRFRRHNMQLSWEQVASIASIGISPFAVQILGAGSNVLINRSFLAYAPSPIEADQAIGALGIVNSYAMVGFMLIIGISQGMQPIVGFNHGAGRHDRVLKTAGLATGSGWLIGLGVTILGLLFPREICGIFTQHGGIYDAAVNAMTMCIWAFAFVGSQVMATQFFQSIGYARTSFWLSISRQALFLIPMLLALPRIYEVNGVWLSLPLSDLFAGLGGLLLMAHYFRGRGYSLTSLIRR